MKYLLYNTSAAQYVDGITVSTSYDPAQGHNETCPKFSTSALMGNALSFKSVANLGAFVTNCMEYLEGFEFDWANYRIDAFEEGVSHGETETETEGE